PSRGKGGRCDCRDLIAGCAEALLPRGVRIAKMRDRGRRAPRLKKTPFGEEIPMKFTVLAAVAAVSAAALAPAAFAQGGPPGGFPAMPTETAIATVGGEGIEITMPDVLDE